MKEIVKYIRGKKGSKIGVLIGMKDDFGIVRIGWSAYAASTEVVPFSKEKGITIAKARAVHPRLERDTVFQTLPFSVQKEILPFIDRCKRYFRV